MTLKVIRDYIKKDHVDWEKDRKEKLTAPYPWPSPCSHCEIHESFKRVCDYCIHNHEAAFFEVNESFDEALNNRLTHELALAEDETRGLKKQLQICKELKVRE
jgi:hypothetical protein